MDISKAVVRDSLTPRSEPYWLNREHGCSIGYRRNASGKNVWTARRRLGGEQKAKTLGLEANLSWSAAVKLADQFFKEVAAGVGQQEYSVEQVCKAYVKNRLAEKGETTANDAKKRFVAEGWPVYGSKFGKTKMRALRPQQIEDWRNGIAEASTKGNANRYMRTLKAALNYGHRRDMAPSDRAWKLVPAFPAAEKRRELLLSKADMQAFAEQCPAWLGPLLVGLMHTGARPGELRKATVADVDLKGRTLRLVTHKGNNGEERVRYFPLANAAAYAFFKSQAENRFPLMPLFPTDSGEHMSEAVLSQTVKRTRRKHNWRDDLVAYTYRHSTISHWLDADIPVANAADLAGTSIEKINSNYYKRVEATVNERLAAL